MASSHKIKINVDKRLVEENARLRDELNSLVQSVEPVLVLTSQEIAALRRVVKNMYISPSWLMDDWATLEAALLRE